MDDDNISSWVLLREENTDLGVVITCGRRTGSSRAIKPEYSQAKVWWVCLLLMLTSGPTLIITCCRRTEHNSPLYDRRLSSL